MFTRKTTSAVVFFFFVACADAFPGIFAGQLQFFGGGVQFVIQLDPFLEFLYFFHLRFGAFSIFPKDGVLGSQLFFFEAYGLCIDVKDTPSAPARAPTHLLLL
jgi:hypothetical protein